MLEFTSQGRVCSFCGEVGGAQSRFAGGYGAMICCSCIDRYHELSHSPGGIDGHEKPPWDDLSRAELLERFQTIIKTSRQTDDFARAWVDMMKKRGVSWAFIGSALGVTRQAAWEKYTRSKAS